MKKISILLADDHPVVRQGVRSLLLTEPDFEIVGEAENGRRAVNLAESLRPDLVVMDIGMPQLNGIEATRQIVRRNPAARVLILSCHSSDDYVNQLVEAGAVGYLGKQTVGAQLIKAIREVHAGNVYFSAVIARRRLDRWPERGGQSRRLTPRQMEVVQLVAEGCSNKQMAADLGISIKTLEKHRQAAMDKLNIHETAGLTRYAIEQGIIEAAPKMA